MGTSDVRRHEPSSGTDGLDIENGLASQHETMGGHNDLCVASALQGDTGAPDGRGPSTAGLDIAPGAPMNQ